jgi:hypothetical protein
LSGDEKLLEHFQLASEKFGGESQKNGVRSRPIESVTKPMNKILHHGRVTVWPNFSVPYNL